MDEFFDSEDPHPITGDESPYHFDDFPSPRLSQSRKSVPPKQASPVTKRKSEGVTTSSPRRNNQRLIGFIQTLQEVSPLIHLAHHQIEGEFESSQYEDGFRLLIKNHQTLLNDVCDRIGLSQEDLGDRFLVSQLATRISKIVFSLRDLPTSTIYDSVGISISILDKWIGDNSNLIREMIVQEKGKSSDILVNVKLGLFSPTIKLYGLFEKWSIGSWRDKHASWMMDLSVDLAKDVSFNWDKNANFREKHDLFQGVLELCADLVIDTYEDSVRNTIKLIVEEEYSFEHDGLNKFYMAFEKMNVGYKDHDLLNEKWLINRLKIKKDSMLIHYMPVSLTDNENYFVEKFIAVKIDELFSEAWINATQGFYELVANMNDSERDSFLSSEEASKPMPYELFEKELEKIRPRNFELISQNIDLQKIAQKSRKQMSEMWGISDAFCKISKN